MNVLLLDTDGVLFIGEYKYFDEKFSKEHSVSSEMIKPFFKNEFKDCLVGKRDLKQELLQYLEKWNWEGSVDDFLKYWFSEEKKIDIKVIRTVRKLRKKGVRCYLVTDQEKNRAEFLRKKYKEFAEFDGVFFSCEIGYRKDQKEFFEKVLEEVGVIRAENVYYWDDSEGNVNVAKSVGLRAFLYKSFSDFEKEVLNFY